MSYANGAANKEVSKKRVDYHKEEEIEMVFPGNETDSFFQRLSYKDRYK